MSDPDARTLLRSLVPIDRCVAVWCAAQCARTALRYVREGDPRPLQAIEAAEAWGREPTKDRRGAAAAAYANAAYAAYAADAAASAAYAAAAAYANAAYAAYAADAAAYAAAHAADAAAPPRERTLAELHALCLAVRWPLTPAPTATDRRALPSWQQVAWDALEEADLPSELSVEQLLEAHTRRGALVWEGAERALAERILLLPRLQTLAAGGGS